MSNAGGGKKSLWVDFSTCIWKENPVLVMLLGLCPALAVTTSAANGFGMGMSATFVLLCASIIVSSIRNLLNPHTRIIVFVLAICTFVTLVDILLQAYVPVLSKSLGAFVPLIVVNCAIIGRQEIFASKNNIGRSILDALGNGIGITLAFTFMGAIREVLGQGTLFQGLEKIIPGLDIGGRILWSGFYDKHEWLVALLPSGAFLTLGFMVAAHKLISKKGN